MGRYEYFEHTADIGVRAYGDSVEDAFGATAEAMFALITDSAGIEPIESLSFEVTSVDRQGLLVMFLSQLIVIYETDNLVLTDFDVRFTSDNRLTATMRGERYDVNRHGGGTGVKGVSYHMLEITESEDKGTVFVQVLFDV